MFVVVFNVITVVVDAVVLGQIVTFPRTDCNRAVSCDMRTMSLVGGKVLGKFHPL